MSALIVDAVSKRYGAIQALKDVSFTVEPGEIRALLGENGSGKSTMMGILSGFVCQDAGTVTATGRLLVPGVVSDRTAAGVGVVSQESHLCPDLSVAENIFLGRQPSRRGVVSRRGTLAAARRLIDERDLDLDPECQAGRLSLGRQAMVEVASILARGSRVIGFDETTASLPHGETGHLFGVIRQLRAEGAAIVFITHRLSEAFAVCDSVTVLRDGEVRGTLSVSETDEDQIVRMMVGRSLKGQFFRAPAPIGPVRLRAHAVRPRRGTHSFDLTVASGEVVGLAGLVGSGRTTLLKSLFGVVPRLGTVSVDGGVVTRPGPRPAIERGIGFVPERRREEGLALGQSVRANAVMVECGSRSRIALASRNSELALVEELRAELGLKIGGPESPVWTLSGGNQQKLMLGRWLHRNPAVLLLDEPSRGVDVGAKREIYRLIEQAAMRGCAVLMSSSELPELIGLCDRILVMREGRIVDHFDRGANEEKLTGAMTGAGVLSPTGSEGMPAVALQRQSMKEMSP